MRRFEGKSVLVTGASRGLGRAMAQAFAKEGAFVWVHFTAREAEAHKTLASLSEAGGEGELVRFDLRDGAAIQAGIQQVVKGRGAPRHALVSGDTPPPCHSRTRSHPE